MLQWSSKELSPAASCVTLLGGGHGVDNSAVQDLHMGLVCILHKKHQQLQEISGSDCEHEVLSAQHTVVVGQTAVQVNSLDIHIFFGW